MGDYHAHSSQLRKKSPPFPVFYVCSRAQTITSKRFHATELGFNDVQNPQIAGVGAMQIAACCGRVVQSLRTPSAGLKDIAAAWRVHGTIEN